MRNKLIYVLLTALVAVTGCASTSEQPRDGWDPSKLVWPLPPDKPRIKYVDTLSNQFDVAPPSFADSVLGEVKPATMLKPYGVTTDEQGRVYVSDIGRIFVFDKQGGKLTFIGNKGGIGLIRPLGMAYDLVDKRLYVADAALDLVVVYDTAGNPLLAIGQNRELSNPSGVAVDPQRKRVYITNTHKHTVSVYDTDGNHVTDIGERGIGPAKFNFPTQIAIDKQGNIYVVDTGNFKVKVFNPEGEPLFDFGGVGLAFGQFSRPKGIAVDANGYIFVVDAVIQAVTVFNRKGEVLLPWGGRGFERGLFSTPAGIHIDEKEKIYVVSQESRRVDIFQMITYPEDLEETSEQNGQKGAN